MVLTAQLQGCIRLKEGSKVQVHGLKNREELNGKVGRCLQFEPDKLRWGVELPNGQRILLKMANLLPVDAAVEPATAGPNGAPMPAVGAAAVPAATANAATRGAEADAAVSAPGDAGKQEAGTPQEKAGATGQRTPACTAEEPADVQPGTSPLPCEAELSRMTQELQAKLSTEQNDQDLPELKPATVDKSGRWWQNESASDKFADQLRANEPALKSLCLVPPKRFAEEDVEKICDALEVNTCCEELLASGHALSEAGCKRLSRMLRVNHTLQTLSVGDSSLADRACLLFEGLSENKGLTSLDLEHKGLTPAACRALADALAQRAQLGAAALTTLRLSRNAGIKAASSQLACAPAPKELLLWDSGLGEEQSGDIGRWVAGGVEDLDLRENTSLGGDGLDMMLRALLPKTCEQPPALQRLRLDGCAVGDDGLEAFAAACDRGLELEELFLERNEVTADGCRFLAPKLRRRKLRMLSVRGNLIGDEGCELLAECAERLDLSATNLSPAVLPAFGEQSAVTSLELFNNPKLGGQAPATWVPELRCDHWQQLEQLDMSACSLGSAGFRLLCSTLLEKPRLMPKLRSLCLGGNEVEDTDELQGLSEKLAAARSLRVIWRNT